jgi:IclR family acetate operon transcriptional repressor
MKSSVARLIETLDLLAESREGMSVTEVSRRLHISKAASSRLLSSLIEHDIVEKDAAQRHVLGVRLNTWGAHALNRMRLTQIARPSMIEAARANKHRVSLAVLRGSLTIYCEAAAPKNDAVVVSPCTDVIPVHANSAGKAILAFRPAPEIEEILAGPLPGFTASTIRNREKLELELNLTRERGYATNMGEFRTTIFGISAPILDESGFAIAALNFSCDERSFTQTEKLSPALIELCETVSTYMGYLSPTYALSG